MLIKIRTLNQKYKLNIKGICHIGAHMCEELQDYKKEGVMEDKILWIEANPNLVDKLKMSYKNLRIINAIVSDTDNQEIVFNVANNGQSSSILELGTHKTYYKDIKYVDKIKGQTKTLKTIYKDNNIPNDFANFLNIDIQGAELLALKGMNDLLNHFDYLYLEVNKEEVYKGCGLINEIDDYLKQYGFKRIETQWTNNNWGDAYYSRIK